MMNTEKHLKTMNTIFTIAGGLWAVWTVYQIVRNIRRPNVSIDTVNYTNGTAVINSKGKLEMLYKNSTVSVGADGSDWGIRFNGPEDGQIDRIELINRDLVYRTLHKR